MVDCTRALCSYFDVIWPFAVMCQYVVYELFAFAYLSVGEQSMCIMRESVSNRCREKKPLNLLILSDDDARTCANQSVSNKTNRESTPLCSFELTNFINIRDPQNKSSSRVSAQYSDVFRAIGHSCDGRRNFRLFVGRVYVRLIDLMKKKDENKGHQTNDRCALSLNCVFGFRLFFSLSLSLLS